MNGKMEKVTKFKYLGQITHLKDITKEEIYPRIRAAWNCSAHTHTQKEKYFNINNSPYHSKNK